MPSPTAGGTATATASSSTNLALGKPATASSLEAAGYPPSAAFDGDTTTTRWSSAASDPQWIAVDLGVAASISKVVLSWEAASGKAYQIQTSNDNAIWTTIYSTTTGPGDRKSTRLNSS